MRIIGRNAMKDGKQIEVGTIGCERGSESCCAKTAFAKSHDGRPLP
jgi:hypothetical protein